MEERAHELVQHTENRYIHRVVPIIASPLLDALEQLRVQVGKYKMSAIQALLQDGYLTPNKERVRYLQAAIHKQMPEDSLLRGLPENPDLWGLRSAVSEAKSYTLDVAKLLELQKEVPVQQSTATSFVDTVAPRSEASARVR